MIPLFHCEVCGFISTVGQEFQRVEGLLLDHLCAERVAAGDQPARRWFDEKLAAKKDAAS